jgi:hypothetical protein
MQEMDAESVDHGAVLAKFVQHRLASPPVVLVPPVFDQRLDFAEGRPWLVSVTVSRSGQRARQPIAEVGQLRFWDREVERLDQI